MLTRTRMLLAAAVLAAALGAISLAPTTSEPAAAQVGQGGLVNVNVGDITLLENVAVGAAIAAVANLCPAVSVQNIAAAAVGVLQQGGETSAICTGTAMGETGDVTISRATGNGGGSNQGRGVGQVGLVNVNVGDVTILENVAVGAAVAAVVNLCPGVSVQNVALLAVLVAQQGGETMAFCEGTAGAVTGPVTIEDAD